MTKHESKLEKMIAQFCPEGVEYLSFNNVTTSIRTGLNPRQNFQLNPPDGNNYYITVRELGGFDIRISDKTDRVDDVGLALIQNRSNLRVGDVLFSGTGTIGCTALVSKTPFDWNIKEGIYAITPNHKNIDSRFLIYLLHSESVSRHILAKADGSTVSSISMARLKNVTLPIPPLAVQEEIVKILDIFTKLEAELEAELEARKKQYEYYRDDLLTFRDEVEWKTLGEVCSSITAGGDLPENYLKGQRVPTQEYPYPIYSNGSSENALYGFTDSYKVDSEAVTISARGTIGYHAVRKEKFTPIVRLITLIPIHEIVTSRFLNYALDITEIGHDHGGIPQLTVPNVKQIKIPLPPLPEQERIVAILDKFDALVNDISVGLPAELNARRKQYEYYRNKLLTFKPLEKEHANR